MNATHQEYLLWFLVAAIIVIGANLFIVNNDVKTNQKVVREEGADNKKEILENRDIGVANNEMLHQLLEKLK